MRKKLEKKLASAKRELEKNRVFKGKILKKISKKFFCDYGGVVLGSGGDYGGVVPGFGGDYGGLFRTRVWPKIISLLL